MSWFLQIIGENDYIDRHNFQLLEYWILIYHNIILFHESWYYETYHAPKSKSRTILIDKNTQQEFTISLKKRHRLPCSCWCCIDWTKFSGSPVWYGSRYEGNFDQLGFRMISRMAIYVVVSKIQRWYRSIKRRQPFPKMIFRNAAAFHHVKHKSYERNATKYLEKFYGINI